MTEWININLIDITKHRAFVYEIVFEDGMRYIGYKTLITTNNTESKWRAYTSSSKYVNAKINAGEKYTKTILEVFSSKKDAQSREVELLENFQAHKNKIFLNKCIGNSKFFCHPTTEEHKKKLSEAKLGGTLTEAHSNKISNSLKEHCKKNPRTAEHARNSVNARTHRTRVVALYIKGKKFESIRSASIYTGISQYKLKKMIDSKDPSIVAETEELGVIDTIYIDGNVFNSYKEAAIFVGVSQTTIKNRCERGQYAFTFK